MAISVLDDDLWSINIALQGYRLMGKRREETYYEIIKKLVKLFKECEKR